MTRPFTASERRMLFTRQRPKAGQMLRHWVLRVLALLVAVCLLISAGIGWAMIYQFLMWG